jgi:hypothetical protein
MVTLPWRIYTYKVSKGVLAAIHCVEVLQFQASYRADALRTLLPDTVRGHLCGCVCVTAVCNGCERGRESHSRTLTECMTECMTGGG